MRMGLGGAGFLHAGGGPSAEPFETCNWGSGGSEPGKSQGEAVFVISRMEPLHVPNQL